MKERLSALSGYLDILAASSCDEAAAVAGAGGCDVAVIGSVGEPAAVLERLVEIDSQRPVILLVSLESEADRERAFRLVERGAFECVDGGERFALEGAVVRALRTSELGIRLKGLERALAEKTSHMESILRSSIDLAIAATDLDFRIIYLNPVAEKLFGRRAEEVTGRPVDDVLLGDYLEPERIRPAFDTVRRNGEFRWRAETQRDGRRRVIDALITAIRDEHGGIRGFVIASRDITDERIAWESLDMRLRQQALVAEFGQCALEIVDLSSIMDEAVRVVAKGLDVEFAKVLELNEERDAFLLAAGVGWKEGLVGSAKVGAGMDSQAGYTLHADGPVVVSELSSDPRFKGPALLRDHGVVSGLSVLLHGADRPYGVLGAHTAKRRVFTGDDINFLQSVANVLSAAIVRRRLELDMQFVVGATAFVSGEEFFTELVRRLAEVLGVRYALICELVEDGTAAETLAVWAGGEKSANFRYRLKGTPCEQVVTGQVECYYPEGVAELFPEDRMLAEMGIESYRGVALVASSGEVVGLLVVLHDKRMPKERNVETFLRLFASRIGAEIERVRAERRLKYRTTVEKAIARVSARFASSPETTVNEALAVMGEAVDADRVHVCMISDDGRYVSNTHEWCNDGVESRRELLQNIEVGRIAWLLERLGRDENIIVGSVESLSEDAAGIRGLMKLRGARSVIIVPMKDSDGSLTGFIGFDSVRRGRAWSDDDAGMLRVVSDLIAGHRARKRTAMHLKKLENAIEQAVEMVVVTDSSGVIEYVTPAVSRISGYSREELIGRTPAVFKSGHQDGEFYRRLWETIMDGRIWSGELVNRGKDGALWNEEMTISPIKDENGEVTHFVAIKRDISEKKRLEERLRRSERLSSIGTLVSGVAHELNNPLTAILGFSEGLVEMEDLDEHVRSDLDVIAAQSRRAVEIVRGLLRFTGVKTSSKVSLDINELISGVLEFQGRDLARSGIEVRREFTEPLPPVLGDATQLQQVFLNIVSNAQYEMRSANGGGVLTVRTSSSDDEVRAVFENNGPPIPEHVMANIFDPFFTGKKVGDGTGLGLSIAYAVVKEHGGGIWAENIDDGVRFTVTLPAAAPAPREKRPARDAAAASAAAADARVLVVEDDEAIGRWLERVLLSRGFEVVRAANGKEAVTVLDGDPAFDCVLSDVKMPEMTGIELGAWIADNRPNLLGRLVLLTGAIDKEVDKCCARWGCRYMMKPLNSKKLVETVSAISEPSP